MLHQLTLPLLASVTPTAVTAPAAPSAARPAAGPDLALVQANDLLSVIPDSAVFAAQISNPRALLAQRETNDWVAFTLDAQWETVIQKAGSILEEEDITAAEIIAGRELVIQAFSDTTGVVFFADLDLESMEPTMGLVVRGGDDAAALLRRVVGDSTTEVALDGERTAIVGEKGRAELFTESAGTMMLISAPTIEASKAAATACYARLGNADATGPFAEPAIKELRNPGAEFEFAARLGPIWERVFAEDPPTDEFEQRLANSIRSIEWLYGEVSLGDGEVADMNFVMPYDKKSVLGNFLGLFGSADTSLFAHVPAGASQATAAHFNFGGFATLALDIARANSLDGGVELQDGLDAAEAVLGVDLIGDIVNQMTGDMLYFSTGDPVVVDGTEVPFQAMTAIAFMEDTDAIFDLVDQGLMMADVMDMVDTDLVDIAGTDESIDLWKMSEDAPLEMILGAGAGRFLFSLAEESMTSYFDLVSGKEGAQSMLADEGLAAAAKGASGAIVTIQSTAAAADAMESFATTFRSMFDGMAELSFNEEGEQEYRSDLDGLVEAAEMAAALVRQYFDGTSTTEFQIIGDRVRIHARTR